MIATIFLGPSLPWNEAQAILPNANFRPPAAQGDLLTALQEDGAQIVGLIDGTFHQNLSVWHNEVCYLLSRGVRVLGASSMGALRAVETEPFGAVGVGTIYEWYRDSVINGDDEVALLHGDEASGFAQITLPLVNVRASAAQAVDAGGISASLAARIVNIARSIYYAERVVSAVIARGRDEGFNEDELAATERVLTTDYIDLKGADARQLLKEVRQIVDGNIPLPSAVHFDFARSSVFEALYNVDRQVFHGGSQVSLQSIMEYAALHCDDYDYVRRTALNREIVVFFGLLLGIQVTREALGIERDRLLSEQGVDPSDLDNWLHRNFLNDDDLNEYLAQEAICVRLRRWIVSVHGFDRGARPLLNEFRMRGDFEELVGKAAEEVAAASAYWDRPEYAAFDSEDPARLAAMHASLTGTSVVGDATVWAEERGFESVASLKEAVRRSVIYHDVLRRIEAIRGAQPR